MMVNVHQNTHTQKELANIEKPQAQGELNRGFIIEVYKQHRKHKESPEGQTSEWKGQSGEREGRQKEKSTWDEGGRERQRGEKSKGKAKH